MRYRITVKWSDDREHATLVDTSPEAGGYYRDGDGPYFEVQPNKGAPIFMIPFTSAVRFIVIEDVTDSE